MDESVNKAADVATTLRYCLLNVTTASINTRKELFNQKLIQTVTNEGNLMKYYSAGCFMLNVLINSNDIDKFAEF